MTVVALPAGDDFRGSPFAGADVCAEAGLSLPPGARRPRFEHDVWDFSDVIGLPVQMAPHARRLEFAPIANPAWRLVAKELMLALLAPRHEAVATLPRASRTPLHLRTCRGRLVQLTGWLNWLDAQGVVGLGEVRDGHCRAYLAHRGHARDAAGDIVGEFGPPIRRAVAQAIVDLVNYRELFSADRVERTLRPWAGASPSAVAGMPNGRDQNKTPPLADTVLAPMLAAALYLTTTLGPPAAILARQARFATRTRSVLPTTTPTAVEDIAGVLLAHRHAGDPLPRLSDHDQRARLAAGPGRPTTRCWPSALTRWPTRPASASSTGRGSVRCEPRRTRPWQRWAPSDGGVVTPKRFRPPAGTPSCPGRCLFTAAKSSPSPG